MGTLLINSAELLSHASDDGNTLTEIAAGVMQKKLFADEFGEVIDPVHWTVGNLPSRFPEGGAVSESSGELLFAGSAPNAYQTKSIHTDALYNNGLIEISANNFTETSLNWVSFGFWKDSNNYVQLSRYRSGLNKIYFHGYLGGVSFLEQFNVTGTTFKFKIQRTGNVFDAWYDVGAGYQACTQITKAIGADCHVFISQTVFAAVRYCDIDWYRPMGTGIYWDMKSDSSAIKDTYNEQTVAEGAGAIIQYGSAIFDENSNMKYRVQAGTGAWSAVLDSTGIIALGDVVTNNGKFNIEAVYEGGTALAGWTDVDITTVAGGCPVQMMHYMKMRA